MYQFIDPFNIENENECRDILIEHNLPEKGWWWDFPIRAMKEIRNMLRNTTASLKYKEDALIWNEWINTDLYSSFLIEIITENFPFKMPEVSIKEPHIKPNLDFHMYDDGKLCLMHSDDHSSKNSILVYRNQTAAWCFAYEVYRNTGNWPAAEHPH